jgi:hypothetical protein
MSLPEWVRDPDAVLEKRAKAEREPSLWRGLAPLACVVLLVVVEVLDAVAWLGGMKAMGW